jgi:hypothetical protein
MRDNPHNENSDEQPPVESDSSHATSRLLVNRLFRDERYKQFYRQNFFNPLLGATRLQGTNSYGSRRKQSAEACLPSHQPVRLGILPKSQGDELTIRRKGNRYSC